jgi:hypothetical protein
VTPAIDARRIASVYEPRWLRAYVASKLRFDPVYQRVVPLLVESGEPLLERVLVMLAEGGYGTVIPTIDVLETGAQR